MSLPRIASREEWIAARVELLAKEKEFTRQRDVLNAERRSLPMVEIHKEYVFDSTAGKKTLFDLFEGRRQLIVYHFMMPAETGGHFCPGCSFWIDNIGHLAHLQARDTSLVLDCPVPLADLVAHMERMEWTVPGVSSFGTSFYDDFYFTLDKAKLQQPGVSAFVRDGNRIFHTYSTHDRGTDLLNGTYNYLDLTALGRQEEQLDFKWAWLRYHDSYDS